MTDAKSYNIKSRYFTGSKIYGKIEEMIKESLSNIRISSDEGYIFIYSAPDGCCDIPEWFLYVSMTSILPVATYWDHKEELHFNIAAGEDIQNSLIVSFTAEDLNCVNAYLSE